MIDLDENVEVKFEDYIVFVWQGIVAEAREFMEGFFESESFRVQYLEAIETNPTPGEAGTGGRSDLFFALHADDIPRFAVWRLQYGMRWLEDVYANRQGYLYPRRVRKYANVPPKERLGSNLKPMSAKVVSNKGG